MAKTNQKALTAEHVALTEMRVRKGNRSRALTTAERNYLVQMFAVKAGLDNMDALSLAPAGSFLRMAARHFQNTDISYALPIMQTVMLAASKLTQSGAHLDVPGLGTIKPTLWTIGLAESGNSKTLAADEISKVFGDSDASPVLRMPDSGSDAQWIIELAENNGSYWQQDEVGKRMNAILTQKTWARAKPWILDAYSHQSISNRLKGEKEKLEIKSPFFTFHGLSVFSTWKSDIDASSMLDGFSQRFNYYIADRRSDSDIFDHFLYFVEDSVPARREQLKTTWDALCSQPGAFGKYTLDEQVIPYLSDWWKGLRNSIGQSGLPVSFVRRIGFSLMRYLIVLQFLLGKSRLPIDLETALLATKYAEYHMQSALIVLQDYNHAAATGVQKVASLRNDILASGGEASARNISRKLSKTQRQELTTPLIKQIVDVLDRLKSPTELFRADASRTEKSNAMCDRRDQIAERLKLNERKRNERRLRNLRANHLSTSSMPDAEVPVPYETDSKVIPIGNGCTGCRLDPFDRTG